MTITVTFLDIVVVHVSAFTIKNIHIYIYTVELMAFLGQV